MREFRIFFLPATARSCFLLPSYRGRAMNQLSSKVVVELARMSGGRGISQASLPAVYRHSPEFFVDQLNQMDGNLGRDILRSMRKQAGGLLWIVPITKAGPGCFLILASSASLRDSIHLYTGTRRLISLMSIPFLDWPPRKFAPRVWEGLLPTIKGNRISDAFWETRPRYLKKGGCS